VARVSNGTVTAIAEGEATITATSTANSDIIARCAVTVTPVPVPLTGITLNMDSLNLNPNGTGTLTVTYNPATTTEPGVTWTSSNANVATVSGGTVTAVAVGTATITATSTAHTNMTVSCTVTVTPVLVPPTEIALNPNSLNLNPNGTRTLAVTYTPPATTDRGVTWSTSDDRVARVDDDGGVTAIAVGTATITATSTVNSNISASCAVTVTPVPVPVTGLSLTPNSLTLRGIGATGSLEVNYNPAHTTERGVIWSSGGNAVTVDAEGLITAVAAGTATITATSVAHSNMTASATVTVTVVTLAGISLPSAIALDRGVQRSLAGDVIYNPSDTTERGLTWTSSNTSVATVSGGVVIGVGGGNAVITARSTAYTNITAACNVTVNVRPLTGISLGDTPLALDKGQQQNLAVTYDPENTTEKGVAWSSSDTNVATVNAETGLVTAVGGGNATITATSTRDNSKTAIRTVNVTVPLVGISLTPTPLTITGIGNTGSFTVIYDPPDATGKDVTWTSNYTWIATVEPTTGLITTVNGGATTITATSTTNGSITASGTVNVVIPLTGISLNNSTLNLSKGAEQTLTATYDPANTTETGLIWSSSDPAVARVSGGVYSNTVTITARGEGTGLFQTATITVRSTAHDNILATCDVTVDATVLLTGISLPSAITMGVGQSYLLPAGYIPADTTQTGLAWSSNNTSVATVDPATGLVTADNTNTGTATITATSTANGSISATCDVTVQAGFAGAGIDIVFEGPGDETMVLDEPVREGDMLTVTAPDGYDRYLWYLDNSSLGTTNEPTRSLYFDSYYLRPGLHYLTVIVEKGGEHFSKTLAFRVGY
jgi:uncharacterized protein YjdB